MAVPVLIAPYIDQNFTFNDPISIDISPNWQGALLFEIASLPPDVSYITATTSLEGTATTNMNYTVYIRGVNSDGAGEWAPMLITTIGQSTARTLWGLSLTWQQIIAAGLSATIFIKQATVNGVGQPGIAGRMLINDVANDGNASIYASNRLYSQIILNGGNATFLRASQPGWEVILDISQRV